MKSSDALRNAIALGATVGAAYAACTLAFWIWPEQAAQFMNGLFHGLDFRRLQAGPSLFRFGGFVYGLLGMMAWAFGLGFLYTWTKTKLAA
jgi:hypothetical protein